MKTKIKIKNILIITVIYMALMFFMNVNFASNTAKVITETAKIRKEPSTTSTVLELASMGEEVEVLEKQGEWYKIVYKKITGYIRGDLLEVKEEVVQTSTSSEENEEPVNEEPVNEEPVSEQPVEEPTNEQPAEAVPEEENNGKEEFENGKYKVTKQATMKVVPIITSLDLRQVNVGEEVLVSQVINKWAWVTTSDSINGWMIIESLEKVEENTEPQNVPAEQQPNTSEAPQQTTQEPSTKTMYVNSKVINVREKPNKTSKAIMQLKVNAEVTVISEEDGWYKVSVNNKEGYILKTLLSDKKQETSRSNMSDRQANTNVQNNGATTQNKQPETTQQTTAQTTQQTTQQTIPQTSNSVSSTGSQVVEYAKTYLGYKYVYGGTTTKGFDCSGFTQFVYKHFGVTLNRTAAAQYKNGTSVTALQAGDLVMFGTSASNINHVGIYIGGGTFIHAANTSRGVTTDTLSSGYYKTHYIGARRIL